MLEKTPRGEPVRWFAPGKAEPNDHEILFFALIAEDTAQSAAESGAWAKNVLGERKRAEELQVAWRPLSPEEGGLPLDNKKSTFFWLL